MIYIDTQKLFLEIEESYYKIKEYYEQNPCINSDQLIFDNILQELKKVLHA